MPSLGGLGRRLRSMFAMYRGLPAPIYALFLATTINGAGIFVFPFLTLFLTERLGWSAARAGSFMLAASLAYVPGTLIGGRLADRFGRKKVMLASQVLAGLVFLPCGFAAAAPALPALVLANLFFDGVTDPARTAMCADLTRPENRQGAYSLLYLGHNLGFACGPLIAGFLFRTGSPWLFWGNAIAIGAASCVVAALVPETKPGAAEIEASLGSGSSEEAHQGGLLSALASRPYLLAYSALTMAYGFVYAQHRFALPLQATAWFGDSGSTLFGGLMTLNAVLVILLTTPVVAITRKRPPIFAVAAAGLLFAAGFGMIGLARTPALMYLATAIWTLGEIVNATNDGAYVANHTPMSHRGRFQSILPIIAGTGFALSSPIVGGIIDGPGLGLVWPLLCVVALAASAGITILGLVEQASKKRGAAGPIQPEPQDVAPGPGLD